MPIFKPEISLGTVVELLSFIVVVIGAIHKFGVLETKLNVMYTWFEQNVLNESHMEQMRASARKKFFGATKQQGTGED
jgi:hypothetical protein